MRIEYLHLIAFGPFTGVLLDFGASDAGLHLVYGPNEAGKSSALRGLRSLFYGISERSPDNFIHPYSRMRVGGRLCSSSGEQLEIIRRKGRVNTLRAGDDSTVVDESVLSGFLNHVDADLFSAMFGIGYDDLVTGGSEAAAGGGDLGQLIFSAGSGIVHLKEVRDSLKAEAEALFKPHGKNPSINACLSELREKEKRLKETQLPGSRWSNLDRELNETLARLSAVEQELSANEKERGRLERIREGLPLLARRRELLDGLKQYSSAVLLPEDFPEKRRDLAAGLDMEEKEAARAGQAISRAEEEMKGLSPEQHLLDNADLIEKFHQQLGSQQKASSDRVKLETRRSAALGEAREILRSLSDDLTLEEAEKLRIRKDKAAAVRSLASEYEQITARLESAREDLPWLSGEIERLESEKQELEKPADSNILDALRSELAEAGELTPLEKQNSQALCDLDRQGESLARRAGALGLSASCSRDLENISAPSPETVKEFEDRFSDAGRRLEELSRERDKAADRIREARAGIQSVQAAHSIVSEADLEEARERRSRGWRLIRAKLLGEEPDSAEVFAYLAGGSGRNEPGPEDQGRENLSGCGENCARRLADVFEQRLGETDELSDRLRREADRVAEHARLTAELSAAEQKKRELDQAVDKAEGRMSEVSAEWEKLWSAIGVRASSPREMERWTREFSALKNDFEVYEKSRAQAESAKQAVDRCRAAAAERMRQAGLAADQAEEPLSRLVRRAGKFLDEQEKLAAEHEKIDSELASRKRELSAARSRIEAGEKALSRWRQRWSDAVSPLGLAADSHPSEADAVMEELRSLFEKLKDADILEKRIKGIDSDAREFARGVSRLVQAAAPDLCEKHPEDAVLELHRRLTSAREAKTRYSELEKQVSAERKNLEKADAQASDIRARLERMCREAGCRELEELPAAEEKSRKRRALEDELKSVEERILAVSGGETVEEFAARAAGVDPDSIEPEISRLEEAVSSLSGERNRLVETTGRLRNELTRMDGSPEAARLAEERQEILGRLDPLARRYARLKLSAHILDRAIERFREKNQGPMLGKASELFARITCGAFEGVRAEFDESGRPVIAGVRGSEKEVVPVSAMSDGTADQLYLSLRLAGLESAIERTGPMPFIVDDILVKFDNMRAAAALHALADLATRTQVIFFTHHRHLVRLAEQNLPSQGLFFHELG